MHPQQHSEREAGTRTSPLEFSGAPASGNAACRPVTMRVVGRRSKQHLAYDAQGCNARVFDTTVVKKYWVPNAEVISQQIACLIRRVMFEGNNMRPRMVKNTCLITSNASPSCFAISDEFIHLPKKLMSRSERKAAHCSKEDTTSPPHIPHHVVGVRFHQPKLLCITTIGRSEGCKRCG